MILTMPAVLIQYTIAASTGIVVPIQYNSGHIAEMPQKSNCLRETNPLILRL